MKGVTTIGGAGDTGCGCWKGGKGWNGCLASMHAFAGESNRIGNKETKTHEDLEDEHRRIRQFCKIQHSFCDYDTIHRHPTHISKSPILPHRTWHHRPHDLPMPNRALPVPRPQLPRLSYPQHLAVQLEVVGCESELVLRDQEPLARAAAEEVGLDGFAKRDCGGVGVGCGRLLAKDYYVGEVGRRGGGGGGWGFGNERVEGIIFAEGAA
jgi:hypothetical protein